MRWADGPRAPRSTVDARVAARIPRTPDDATQMRRRLVSTLVALPIVALALWAGGIWFAGLAALGASLGTNEYLRAVYPRPLTVRALAIGTSAALPLLAAIRSDGLALAFVAVVVASIVAWATHLRLADNAAAEHGMGHLLAAVVLPSGGLATLAMLRVGPDGLGWASLVVLATVANDATALFVGKLFGRRRLLPRVSPHKTWEGFAGGTAGSLLAIALVHAILLPGLTALDVLVVLVITSVAGPLGDLSQSMVKRAHDLDDFGDLLPGHGGVLDRIDSLLFNAPLLLVWVGWLRP